MPKVLKRKRKNQIAVLEHNKPTEILFRENEDTVYTYSDGTVISPKCINCIPQFCRKIMKQEIECTSFKEMSHDMTLDVCPVDAISAGEKSVVIDEAKCIGCGLCVARCPVGALSIKNNKAHHNSKNVLEAKWMDNTSDGVIKQRDYIVSLSKIAKGGAIRIESNDSIKKLYDKIKRLNQEQQNILARNMLIMLGNRATLSRHGNVYLRMDGYYESNECCGVVEVETGFDMLDVSRAILDDIATLSARYNIKKDDNRPLAICLSLPNKRTDYWQVVQDINEVTDIRISTVTFGGLLVLLWNHKRVRNFSDFYIDIDDSSIRDSVETLLGRRIHISDGYLGVLENAK